jgi:hypothetical protein
MSAAGTLARGRFNPARVTLRASHANESKTENQPEDCYGPNRRVRTIIPRSGSRKCGNRGEWAVYNYVNGIPNKIMLRTQLPGRAKLRMVA